MDPLAALLGRRRRTALVTAGVALAALIGLGVVVAGGTAPTGFDRAVRAWLAGWLSASRAQAFAQLGSIGVVVPGTVCAALVFGVRRWFRGVVLVALAPVVAVGLVEAAKPVFGRTIAAGLSYPSGHTAAVSALFLAVVVTATGPGRRILSPWRIALAVVGLGIVVFLCAAGLVVAGYHYATDTIGGFTLASATVLLLALAIDAAADRLTRSRPVSPADVTDGSAETFVR